MVVPHGDPDYYAAPRQHRDRASRRRARDAAIDLDGFFGLHPSLAPLEPLWDERRLAIVHACGSPDTTRSHFDAQDYMESGTPGVKSTEDGWLARGLAAAARERRPRPSGPWRSGPSLPRVLRGDAGAVAMTSLADFDIQDGGGACGRRARRAAVASSRCTSRASAISLYGTGRETFDAVKMLKGRGAATPPAGQRRASTRAAASATACGRSLS